MTDFEKVCGYSGDVLFQLLHHFVHTPVVGPPIHHSLAPHLLRPSTIRLSLHHHPTLFNPETYFVNKTGRPRTDRLDGTIFFMQEKFANKALPHLYVTFLPRQRISVFHFSLKFGLMKSFREIGALKQ